MVLLVVAVVFLANNLTAFLIVVSLIERYTLISPTDDIVTLSIFISNSSSLSFRSDAWKMETREQFTFALSRILIIPRYPSLENVAIK